MEIYFIALLAPIVGGLMSLICRENFKLKVVSFFSFVSMILCLIPALKVLFTGESLSISPITDTMFGALTFVIDPLAAFFIVVISVMGFMSTLYSNGYMKPYLNKGMNISSHGLFFSLLLSSMLAVVTIQNALFFLIAWEIMSLSSFFLVIFEDDKKEVLNAGIKYLIYMHISVVFIILTFAILTMNAGSFDFSSFSSVLQDNPKFADLIFILGFIGFGIKAGFVPFHNWLPEAHPAAPSHISGVMSGVMIKTGIYGILRILSLIVIPSLSVSYFVLIISVITAMYGILYAISQHDVKRMLAYSSVENIGIIGIGTGVGMLGLAYNSIPVAVLGFAGAVLHILNHSIFKELLFFTAGSVYNKSHTRNMEVLGGLIKSMPCTAFLGVLGFVAICGLPPFNGFISEFLIYFGMLQGVAVDNLGMLIIMILAIAGLAIVGTMAILCFTKAYSIIFLGSPRSEAAEHVKEDVSISMLLPMGCLALFALLIGLFPHQILKLVFVPVSMFVQANIHIPCVIGFMQNIAFVCVAFIMFLALLVIIKCVANRKAPIHCTWGCGYDKPNNHIQYTASSYASPFLSMLTPLFKKVFDIKKPKELFPKDSHFSLQIEDVEEAYFLTPVVKNVEKFLSKFERIQNGNIQQYILYGLIFLILMLIGLVFLG